MMMWTLTDPDDFENRAADEDEFSDMEDLLGLKDLGKEAASEGLDKPIEVKQEILVHQQEMLASMQKHLPKEMKI